jgi:hypothetical protein
MPDSIVSDAQVERQRRVRAGFVAQGSSLSAWCRANGVQRQNAHKALVGQWSGPKADELVARITVAAGTSE